MHYKDTFEKAEKAKKMLMSGNYTRAEVRKHFKIAPMTLWRWMIMVEGPLQPTKRVYKRGLSIL